MGIASMEGLLPLEEREDLLDGMLGREDRQAGSWAARQVVLSLLESRSWGGAARRSDSAVVTKLEVGKLSGKVS